MYINRHHPDREKRDTRGVSQAPGQINTNRNKSPRTGKVTDAGRYTYPLLQAVPERCRHFICNIPSC